MAGVKGMHKKSAIKGKKKTATKKRVKKTVKRG